MEVYIVGVGPGREDYLTGYARKIISEAELVIATGRLYDGLAHVNENTVCKKIDEIADSVIEARETFRKIAVLVSGDCSFYSGARQLRDRLSLAGITTVHNISGISSLQYLTSAIGTSYEDAKTISVHGREGSIVPYVCYNRKVFSLTGGEIKAHTLIHQLLEAGLEDVMVTVGENLSAPDERIVTGLARDLRHHTFTDLSLVFVQNDKFVQSSHPVRDNEMLRSTSPMTKYPIRALAVSLLDVRPTDTVLDIGAGTGSVAIALARAACEGWVFAVERNAAALELLEENRKRLGAFNMSTIKATAPAGISDLPPVDKVFIGGSLGGLREIVEVISKKNPLVEFVVTAITLETLASAVEVFKQDGRAFEIFHMATAEAQRQGNFTMMKGLNPVYLICGRNNVG